jgi:hypothetical protein
VSIREALNFALFFKDLGIWYWNINLMQRIQRHFLENFYLYDLEMLIDLAKLCSYNHKPQKEVLTGIQDSLKVHTNDLGGLSAEGFGALVEAVSVGAKADKRWNSLLLKIMQARPDLCIDNPLLVT